MVTFAELQAKKCRHQHRAFTEAQIAEHLSLLPEWKRQDGKINRTFSFKNYYETLAFVNAAAYIFHVEDHHPEITLTYNRCTVKFDTHSVNDGRGGLSENDFICAAKVDAIYAQAHS